ncbi:MAG: sugar transferase [Hyphomicrobiaceae bacterium]|nr:sugar transferase [Hyphomicrobiaceae bacterium]
MKRLFDVAVSAALLLALSPLFVAIAIAVAWDTGRPIFFRQQRIGRHGQPFAIVKFRSMITSGARGPLVTAGGDGRITRVGHTLRHYKLDELPQLWNVIKGDMSLVGPRPEVSRYVRYWSNTQRSIILQVLPGITDPASIKFRNEEELLHKADDSEAYYVQCILPQKLELYESYVASRSFCGDLRILCATFVSVMSRR